MPVGSHVYADDCLPTEPDRRPPPLDDPLPLPAHEEAVRHHRAAALARSGFIPEPWPREGLPSDGGPDAFFCGCGPTLGTGHFGHERAPSTRASRVRGVGRRSRRVWGVARHNCGSRVRASRDCWRVVSDPRGDPRRRSCRRLAALALAARSHEDCPSLRGHSATLAQPSIALLVELEVVGFGCYAVGRRNFIVGAE